MRRLVAAVVALALVGGALAGAAHGWWADGWVWPALVFGGLLAWQIGRCPHTYTLWETHGQIRVLVCDACARPMKGVSMGETPASRHQLLQAHRDQLAREDAIRRRGRAVTARVDDEKAQAQVAEPKNVMRFEKRQSER